jgi:hypothetical protein
MPAMYAVARLAQGELSVLRRHMLGMLEIKGEKRVERGYGAVAVFGDGGIGIEAGEEKAFERTVLLRDFGREGDQAARVAANVVDGFHSGVLNLFSGVIDQVGGQAIEDLLQGFVEFEFGFAVGIAAINFAVSGVEERDFGAQLFEAHQVRFETVVEVGGVVGDFVDQVDELGFERRALVEEIFG